MAPRPTFTLAIAGLVTSAALSAGGCTSFRTTRADGVTLVHHFGYVREERPPSTGGVEVSSFSSLGLHLDRAFTLGLWHSRVETIPLDGRLVLRVADQAQLDAALRALSPETHPEQPCILVDPPR